MDKKPTSKRFKVYIYQGKDGGGNIRECDSTWKGTGVEYKFNDKREALERFEEILDEYCKK